MGSIVVGFFKSPLSTLMVYGSVVSFLVATLVLGVAGWLGKAFERMQCSGERIHFT